MLKDREMTEFLIGAGGWGYFHVPRLNSLEAYARAFNFVEVNSTFYNIPSLQLVKSWKKRVPENFEFSVRCHRDLTHKYKLDPIREVFNTFETMKDIADILNSRFLVLETPSYIDFSNEKIESIKEFFGSLNLKGTRIVWEVRRRSKPIPPRLVALMQESNIIHCVDLSKEEPIVDSDTVYTRVFGKGEHNLYQFTDEEIMEIDERIARRTPETAVVSYHNVKMYKDAARYKIYRETGKFPAVTMAKGQQSLREVLIEDAAFPATKQELVKRQGWKVIDLTEERRVHAYTLLERLPDKQYGSVEEVLNSLPRAYSSIMR